MKHFSPISPYPDIQYPVDEPYIHRYAEKYYMHLSSKLAGNVILVVSLGLGPASAWAEYNSGKIGEAVGAYLNATDMALQLERSRCGYVFKKKPQSFEKAVREVKRYLRPKDQKELQLFLDGEEFKKEREDNVRSIDNWLRSLTHEGYDENTACGVIASNVAMVLNHASQKWEYAKQHYSK